MSVLLSWHEKVKSNALEPNMGDIQLTPLQLVEIAGPGSVVRVMTDRRTV